MNYPPFRPGSGPGSPPPRPPPRAGQQRPGAVVPANVLRALISQSRRRCEAYVEMMRKFGQGLAQLDTESRQMLVGRSDPESLRQLEEYFTAVRAMAERSEQHVAQQIHYEVQFQQVLQAWLYGRPVAPQRHPDAPPRMAPPRNGPERLRPPAPPTAQRGPAGPSGPTSADVMMPPPNALSGYAAHAAAKMRASRAEIATRASQSASQVAPQAAPRVPAIAPQVPQVPVAKPSEKDLLVAKPADQKANGPASKPLAEEPSPPAPPPAEEGSG